MNSTRALQLGRGGCSGDNVPLEYYKQGILDKSSFTFGDKFIFTFAFTATLDNAMIN